MHIARWAGNPADIRSRRITRDTKPEIIAKSKGTEMENIGRQNVRPNDIRKGGTVFVGSETGTVTGQPYEHESWGVWVVTVDFPKNGGKRTVRLSNIQLPI
jgi:hypothetical protein